MNSNIKLFSVFILSLISTEVLAQGVAINETGANPNANAILDVQSENKGLLLPRVALSSTSSASPMQAHVAGMEVYNTATAGDVTPGVYVNDGAKWVSQNNTNIYNANGTVTAGVNRSVFIPHATNLNFNAADGGSVYTFVENGTIGSFAYEEFGRIEMATYGNNGDIDLSTTGTNSNIVLQSYSGTKNVGIGVSGPSEKLDVGNGNVRVRNLNSNNGNVATDRVVVSDANGVLKSIPKQSPILFGGDLTDVIPTPISVSATQSNVNASATLKDITFSISQVSIVTFSYDISYNLSDPIPAFNDSEVKLISTFLKFNTVPSGSSLPVNKQFSNSAIPFENSGNYGVAGPYFNTASTTLVLTPGDYSLSLIGSYSINPDAPNDTTIEFGTSGNDFINIIAMPRY